MEVPLSEESRWCSSDFLLQNKTTLKLSGTKIHAHLQIIEVRIWTGCYEASTSLFMIPWASAGVTLQAGRDLKIGCRLGWLKNGLSWHC